LRRKEGRKEGKKKAKNQLRFPSSVHTFETTASIPKRPWNRNNHIHLFFLCLGWQQQQHGLCRVGRQSDKRSIKSNFILISLLLVVVASLSFVSVYDLIFLDLGGRKKRKKQADEMRLAGHFPRHSSAEE
jgi:hypothetical protein